MKYANKNWEKLEEICNLKKNKWLVNRTNVTNF